MSSFARLQAHSLADTFNKSLTYWYFDFIRHASKKTGTSSRNVSHKPKPKRRGIKYGDGAFVQAGTSLATQRTLRFHPGLNVGFGGNGTLFAKIPGRVMITCEKIEPDFESNWVMKFYEGRNTERIYKKFFNVIPEPQIGRFKLIDQV